MCRADEAAEAPGNAGAPVPRPASSVFGDSDAARELWAAQAQYEAERKSPGWAFAWELLLPGAGNVYAEEKEEALLTWTGLAIGGFFLADGYGLFCQAFRSDSSTCTRKTFYIIQGWVFVIGSRLFGLSSAPTNVSRNNRALRSRLGLEGPVSFGMSPWMARHEGGMRLSLRF